LTNELGIPISFKHLQRITKDLEVMQKTEIGTVHENKIIEDDIYKKFIK